MRARLRPRDGSFVPPRGMRGQSMAESIIVALFFLAPFFLMIVLVGKFITMRSATLQAARYTAFERTVYSNSGYERDAKMAKLTDAQLANAVKMRFFSSGFTGVTQQQNDSLANFGNLPLWVDQGGNQLVGKANQVTATAQGNAEPGSFATDKVLDVTLKPLRDLVGAGFVLTMDKYYTANVAVKPKMPIGPTDYVNLIDGKSLTFSARDVLLADGWSAADEKYERCQAATAVPTSILGTLDNDCATRPKALASIGKLVSDFQSIIGFVIPDLGSQGGGPVGFGYIDVTDAGSVPADRLKNYNPPGGGTTGVSQSQIDQVIAQYAAMGFSVVSNTKQADGSVVLVFQRGSSVVTVTLNPSGGMTTSSSVSLSGNPYTAWQTYSGQMASSGFTVSSVTYICAGGVTCAAGQEQNAVEVDGVLSTPNGTTTSVTVVPDPAKPGSSLVTTG